MDELRKSLQEAPEWMRRVRERVNEGRAAAVSEREGGPEGEDANYRPAGPEQELEQLRFLGRRALSFAVNRSFMVAGRPVMAPRYGSNARRRAFARAGAHAAAGRAFAHGRRAHERAHPRGTTRNAPHARPPALCCAPCRDAALGADPHARGRGERGVRHLPLGEAPAGAADPQLGSLRGGGPDDAPEIRGLALVAGPRAGRRSALVVSVRAMRAAALQRRPHKWEGRTRNQNRTSRCP